MKRIARHRPGWAYQRVRAPPPGTRDCPDPLGGSPQLERMFT